MTLASNLKQRGRLAVGQRVQVNQRFRDTYAKSKKCTGVIMNFCRDTELRIQFDGCRYSQQLDERFVEPANG